MLEPDFTLPPIPYDEPDRLAALRELAPKARIEAASDDPAQRRRQLARADVVIGGCSAANFADAPGLRWYQAMSVGVENCVAVPGLAERGLVLTNMQRTSAPPIAEHAIAMTMALARGLPTYGRAQQAGEWQRGAFGNARELGGRTLLVVGLGGIGTEVARRADGLGMRVIATRNSGRLGPDFVAKVGLPDELLALAAEADVVVNAAPLTPATTNLFDAKFFNAMKPGGYFINIARGRSVVQDDLVAALRSGQLGGAGLDVTDPEPLPDSIEGLKDRPEARNLVNIYAALAGHTPEQVIRDYAGAQFGTFKPALADLAVAKLEPITLEMNRLMQDPAEIDRILGQGAERADAIARPIVDQVYDIVGMIRSRRG